MQMTYAVKITSVASYKCEENLQMVIKIFHCGLKDINMLCVAVFIVCCQDLLLDKMWALSV